MEWIKLIFTTKTGKVAIGGVLAAVGAFLADKISITELIGSIIVAWQTLNLRHGIRKGS